ncbi:MAG TPA: hypothetical protein VFC46_03410, partial [Humisphaera sp.]|nr:hypothetical protein [Humisphaera sp.]
FDLAKKNGSMRGSGNTDENLNVSAAGRIVLVMHTQEMNANFTGTWSLDRRDWHQIGPIHADLAFSGNSQGGGGNPAAISGGMIFHTSWNTLNARTSGNASKPRSQP